MIIDKNIPMADGILFDEVYNFDDNCLTLLKNRGVIFLTNFEYNDKCYGGSIIASSEKEAEDIAFSRGLGETVIGVMV